MRCLKLSIIFFLHFAGETPGANPGDATWDDCYIYEYTKQVRYRYLVTLSRHLNGTSTGQHMFDNRYYHGLYVKG